MPETEEEAAVDAEEIEEQKQQQQQQQPKQQQTNEIKIKIYDYLNNKDAKRDRKQSPHRDHCISI